jgi:hypothetical protein
MLERPADRSMKMSDEDEKQIREILARFSDGPESKDAKVQQFKETLEAFLENGPGTREERQLIVLDKLLLIDASYKDFRSRRN